MLIFPREIDLAGAQSYVMDRSLLQLLHQMLAFQQEATELLAK